VLEEALAVDDYEPFAAVLRRAQRVLYLADNAGEIVFDRVLIEALPAAAVTAVVKSEPFINDATAVDASATGLEHVAAIMEIAPGVTEPQAFGQAWHEADAIIAKGQANYEALSAAGGPTFFLLIAKCDLVARHIGVKRGDVILQAQTSRVAASHGARAPSEAAE